MHDQDVEDFLAHYGVLGMKWGVRNDKKRAQLAAKARAKKRGPNQLRSESKRIEEAGGGMKGTVRVRKEMLKTGELSKSDARKGAARFGRNLAIGTTVGIGAAFAIKSMSGGVGETKVRDKEKTPMSKQEKIGLAFIGGILAVEGFLTLTAFKMRK